MAPAHHQAVERQQSPGARVLRPAEVPRLLRGRTTSTRPSSAATPRSVNVGDFIGVEPGGRPGPRGAAFDDIIARDEDADWNPTTKARLRRHRRQHLWGHAQDRAGRGVQSGRLGLDPNGGPGGTIRRGTTTTARAQSWSRSCWARSSRTRTATASPPGSCPTPLPATFGGGAVPAKPTSSKSSWSGKRRGTVPHPRRLGRSRTAVALRGRGYRVHETSMSEVASIHPAGSKGPDAVHRRHARLRRAASRPIDAETRVFPAAGFVVSPRRSIPQVMLEAMRVGINEWIAGPGRRRRARRRAAARRAPGRASARRGQVVRVHRRQGRRRHTTVAVNLATAMRSHQGARRCCSTCTGPRRRRGVPRRRAAVLGARRAREHPPPRRDVSSRAWSRRPRPAVDLLASANRPARRLDRRAARARRCSSSRRRMYPLRRPRLPAIGSDRARRARRGVTGRGRRQPGTGDAAERQPHGALLRQRCGTERVSSWRSAASTRTPRSAARTSSACSAAPVELHVSRATTERRWRHSHGASRCLDNHSRLASSLRRRWRASSAGSQRRPKTTPIKARPVRARSADAVR